MKFDSESEKKLLKICLQTKQAQYIPMLYDYAKRFDRKFDDEEFSLSDELAKVCEHEHKARLAGKIPSRKMQEYSKKLFVVAIQAGIKPQEFTKFKTTYLNLLETKRLLDLKTPEGRTDFDAIIEDIRYYSDNPEDAPTKNFSDFSKSMIKRDPGIIAERYNMVLGTMKETAKKNRLVDDSYIERLGTFQQHLRTAYPIVIRAPQKKPTLTDNPLLNDIKNGVPVDLAISNASKSYVGRQTLAKLIATGILIPAMVISAIGFSNAAPTNNSHYNDFLKTGTVGHLFPEDTKEQIFNIGTQLTNYRENELPTNDEFNEFINTIDAFYSNTIKGVLTNSYNEYADETGKPRATSVKFSYNDYDGNRNILRITDESGKTYDVETNTNGVFEHNTIGVIYDAERKIDNYRERFEGSKSVSTKQTLLNNINDDFYNVLDALTLDYSFEEAGFVSRIFGPDLVLVESSQEKEIKAKGPVDHIQTVQAPEIDDDDAR